MLLTAFNKARYKMSEPLPMLPATVKGSESHKDGVLIQHNNGSAMIGKMQLLNLIPTEKGEMMSNLRPDDERERVMFGRAMAPSDGDLSAYLNQTIEVVGVVLDYREFESMSVQGETEEKPAASMILSNGTVIGTAARAVVPYLAFLIGARGRGEWNPPVMLEVRQHQSKRGPKKYYSLREAMPAQAGGGKKGGK